MTERAPSNANFKDRSKEKLVEMRKRASEKVGRLVANLTFDKSTIEIADYDDENPEKYEQDFNFATYESNLRESHYQDQKETREYYKDKLIYRARRLGAYAMFVPGYSQAAGIVKDIRFERQLQKKRRQGYKQEHGTLISKAKDQWSAGKARLNALDEQKAQLDARKSNLG